MKDNPYEWRANLLVDGEPPLRARRYRVTAWRTVQGAPASDFVVGDCRWYWSACAVAVLWHLVFRLNVNIWERQR